MSEGAAMTPIEQEIEKLAEKLIEKHATGGSLGTRFLSYSNAGKVVRELIPLIREECAKIADDCTTVNKTIQYRLGCMAVAAAIREGK